MKNSISIHWFRQDLRLKDNPALNLATNHSQIVLPIYILDNLTPGRYAMGEASRWWLHNSLIALNKGLGGALSLYKGNPIKVLKDLIDLYNITGVYWNRCYEPWRKERDTQIKEYLKARGILVETTNGSLLWEPWTVTKDDGSHYKVFTPFYKKGCLNAKTPRKPIPPPQKTDWFQDEKYDFNINSLGLLSKTNWHQKFLPYWEIGEIGATKCLTRFINQGLKNYKEGRNSPSEHFVSRLSPHLHFGEISPSQVWYDIKSAGQNSNIDHFCSELGWREFSYSQLHNNPDLPVTNLQKKFDSFPWVEDKNLLNAWEKGQSGIPMVDAGMRELWETGYMHNRVRMIVGSFLVKNLRIHWHHGERWFWNTLLDADLANNSASWQWIAGCGADAAPYFRIFNPVTQGQKFDSDGNYIRKFIPELSPLPNKYLFNPWEAPKSILDKSGIKLGKTYPKPIVDLKISRNDALEAFQSLKRITV